MRYFIILFMFACSEAGITNLRTSPIAEIAPKSGEVEVDPDKEPDSSDELKTAFTSNLLPLIESQCKSCHALPSEATSSTLGPLTILDAEKSVTLVKNGSSSIDNSFINKLNGRTAHTGPTPCTSTSSPLCIELVKWAADVRGEEETAASVGLISKISWNGFISGYAYKESSPDLSVDVEIVVNDSAEPISITADKAGFVNGVMGDHRFTSQLDPATFEHSEKAKVNVYAIIDGARKELSNSPMEVVLYKPSAEDYFDTEVSPKLATCASGGCHNAEATWTYNLAIERLADKTPDKGGTATKNTFFDRASGLGGHAGGNVCDRVEGLCDAISGWWTEEFEPSP